MLQVRVKWLRVDIFCLGHRIACVMASNPRPVVILRQVHDACLLKGCTALPAGPSIADCLVDMLHQDNRGSCC